MDKKSRARSKRPVSSLTECAALSELLSVAGLEDSTRPTLVDYYGQTGVSTFT
jgi:hypothetical protein